MRKLILARPTAASGRKAPRLVLWLGFGGLLVCIVAAHFSYQYFEMRFLKLKERFAVIESRPA